MSDVSIATPAPASGPSSAPAAAPVPAPASHEVPISQNPVGSPQPVGAQAPDKPVGELERGKGRPESRRDSIKKAFDRINERDGEAAPPKKRGMGDNNPPEEMQKEPELDLRKPPQQQERYREAGKFARHPDQGPNTGQPGAPSAKPGQISRSALLPETAPYREPPPRFSERGKQEWAAAPEGVRGEVYRMAKEFEGAYRQYRGDHEEMNNIRHFHEMATQHGTTLARALNNYVTMEQKLRADPIGGLDVIVNNLNLRTPEGQKIGFRDIAYHVLSQNPDQLRLMQQGNAQQAASHQLGALHQEVTGLKQALHQMHTERVFGQTRGAVDQFADTHPRFDELGDLIEQEIQLGFTLEEAYLRADRLRPATRAAQTRSTAPAQTREDKSIRGAPDSGPSDGQRRRNDKPLGRREAIQDAIRRVNGGV